jgi:enoyl-CoA hydratase/carnithine racemase
VPATTELVVALAPPVATITINRPEKRNALTLGLWAELGAAVEALDRDAEVAVIILTGAGDAFCAGFDLSDLSTEDDASRSHPTTRPSSPPSTVLPSPAASSWH